MMGGGGRLREVAGGGGRWRSLAWQTEQRKRSNTDCTNGASATGAARPGSATARATPAQMGGVGEVGGLGGWAGSGGRISPAARICRDRDLRCRL